MQDKRIPVDPYVYRMVMEEIERSKAPCKFSSKGEHTFTPDGCLFCSARRDRGESHTFRPAESGEMHR
jgi:hypothetical protein